MVLAMCRNRARLQTTAMMRLRHALRLVRDYVPGLRRLYWSLREPYYRTLERFFPSGMRVKLPSRDVIRLHPRFLGMIFGGYEPELARLMARHVKPGAMILDLGAHVGFHTLMLSRRAGSLGRVFAVEPSPATATLLMQHLRWNNCDNVQVIEALIGDEEREVAFAYRPDPMDPDGLSNSLAGDIGGKTATVRMTTIDRICAGCHPDLIKMDIEGAELLALRGARETLARAAPLLVVSVHPEPMRALGTEPEDLVAFLGAFGYEGHDLDGRPVTDPGHGEFIFKRRTALA
jgi:FkbM family methyltransferase